MRRVITEIVTPSTDRAVFIQVVIVVVAWVVSAALLRRNRDLFHFVTGIALMILAWRGIRATH